ncbi:gliding motility-associated ABC transporter substrate-binding protein GldG [Flavobacterium sp. NKUCC04_CG]|uniref:gliding motility-associated ABC transporter substrate-binding protein GldG n=1 Tax=Flavobacterium sp. NKUCC04_CG TaxID=2842121 RepID=UPI001C5B99AB|nr:gliding motility-associated ABC transporter substrate-binding protein GldG [Flavobacterium sp. NKUCC04_CG]MBW3519743.1 gliding motility-associated ABC transporter substrate-binding protein GldG [Flavobacterium sp. NKUCC04_CG]
MNTKRKQRIISLLGVVVLLVLINVLGGFFFKRWDLTQDKRYTLSATSLEVIKGIKEPLFVDVFLEGQFPQEFKRLQTETRQLLEEFKAYNSNINFQFINPVESEDEQMETAKKLFEAGMKPINITVSDKGKQVQEMVFPWAVATYAGKNTQIPLLKNMMGANTEEKVVSSVQHLEYAIADAIHRVTTEKRKKIAIIKGNGELDDHYIADFLKSVRENYFIGPFTLDSVATNPVKSLEELQKYDLAIIAKPSLNFSEDKIEVLDQFIMNGGKTIWLIDQVQADMDSLNATGSMMVYPKDQSLGEMLFKYGVRINPVLVKDEQATPIKLAVGRQGSETQYEEFIWKFAPFAYPQGNHPIVKNIEGVKFDFANAIDTLKNDIKKTILLQSSRNSATLGTPAQVSLDMVNEEVSPADYQGKGFYNLAVLLEGNFKSVFQNRILPFKPKTYQEQSGANQMIVVADGDVIRNQLDQNYQPLELGYDKWTNKLYGNKEFILNAVNYLLDDSGLINIRTKNVSLPLLDKQKVYERYTYIQVITVGLPLFILLIFGFGFTFYRKRRFARKC